MRDGLDPNERTGFQSPREHALADWRFRKDDQAFRALCSRLYQARWQKRRREEQPERVRENLRRWREAHREECRAKDRARREKTRRPRPLYAFRCDECGVDTVKDRPARFCGKACANRHHAAARAALRNRGIRTMTLTADVCGLLAKSPGLSLRQIAAALPHAKRGSIATKLCDLTKSGELVRTGHAYYPAEPPSASPGAHP